MKPFRFVAWATLTFAAAWAISHRYQLAIASVAGRLAAPGKELEWAEVEIFFPYDLSVYAALCLSSAWVGWKARLRALGMGLAAMVVVEVLALVVAVKVLMAAAARPEGAAEALRFVDGLIRIVGLAAAGATWMYTLGWQRLPQFARGLERRIKV